MSKQCELKSRPLSALDAAYLELTPRKGALRCLRPGEDVERARGLFFECPVCRGQEGKAPHGITILFDGVDPALRPKGRYLPLRMHASSIEIHLKMPTLAEITIIDKIKPEDIPCGWTGFISAGMVKWK